MRVRDLAALRVVNFHGAAELCPDALEHGHTLHTRRAVTIPRSAVVISVGTDDGNGLDIFTQRQNVFVVPQKDHALARGSQSNLLMLGRVDQAFRSIRVSDVRMIENTDDELHSQHITDSIIQGLH